MKKQLLLCGAIAMALAGWGKTLSPESALARAIGEGGEEIRSRSESAYTLSHTFRWQEAAVGYVFTTGQRGFLLVSADDIAVPTLGYSDVQIFDPNDVPDGFQYWIETYAREVEWANNRGETQSLQISRTEDREPISPMVTTKWNQDEPYNDLCPVIQGRRCVTGCVATAMAQVINYHKYPVKGKGSVKYKIDVTRDNQGNVVDGVDWEFDFANTTFDWSNMLDSYDSDATEVQKKAVATLMSACGASVLMDYSPVESGAYSITVPQALIKYFGYANSAYYTSREYYDYDQWVSLVYDQLKTYGPLLYNGISDTGGHAFVCDGYNGDGYFHFNWGWGGMSDGYFRLTALDPESQGIGGSASGYNYQQGLVCDLKPSEDGERHYSLVLLDPFEISPLETKVGSKVTWGNALVNYSSSTFAGYVDMVFEPVDGGSSVYALHSSIDRLTPPNADGTISYIPDISTTIPMLNDGDYKVYPVWSKDSKDWSPILRPIYGSTYYTAKVKSDAVTFVAETKSLPTLSDVDIEPLYVNQTFRMTANVSNDGDAEYYGRLAAHIVSTDGSTDIFESTPYMVDIMPGASMEIVITCDLTLKKSYTGEAKLVLFDTLSGSQVGDAYDVEIKKSDVKPTLTIGDIEFGDGYGKDQQADDLCFKANVTCTGGYFGGTLYAYIFPYEYGEVASVGYLQSDYVSLESGQTQEIVFKGTLPGGTDGKEYFVAIEYNGDFKGNKLIFTLINKSSAVDEVGVDSQDMILYDLSGRKVPSWQAPKGLYISKPVRGGNAHKIIVK